MRALVVVVVVLSSLAAACGDDGSGQGGSGASASNGTGASTGEAGPGSGTGGPTTGSMGAGGGGSGGPQLLYDGPVGGKLPGWDPAAPIPLVALGEVAAGTFWMTLLSIADDGTLGDNLSPRVLVWGWPSAADAAQVYDGPVGGTLPAWSATAPAPLVALAGTSAGGPWTMTLLHVADDGALSQNVAERVLVWELTSAGAPAYDGPVGGIMPGWSGASPIPLVAHGQATAPPGWWMTLLQVGPNGALSQTVAPRVIVWQP
jgi:hypothetical protein